MKLVGSIKFSDHVEKKIKIRNISKIIILSNIRDPVNLTKIVYEIDKYPGEKYELYFKLTKRKTLKVVVSVLNKDLNVVTVHIILSKRLKWVKKWRRKQI